MKVKSLSYVQVFTNPWAIAYEAPPSMGFSRQEYWSELPFPSPGDLPDPGIEPSFPTCRQMLYHLSHQGRQISGEDLNKDFKKVNIYEKEKSTL